jgi:hypothetical protein
MDLEEELALVEDLFDFFPNRSRYWGSNLQGGYDDPAQP